MNNEKKDKDASYNEFIILAIDLIGGDYNESRRYADKLWNIATCGGDSNTPSDLQSIADGYVQNIQKAVAEFDAVCKGRKMVQVEKIKNICDCYTVSCSLYQTEGFVEGVKNENSGYNIEQYDGVCNGPGSPLCDQ